MSEFLLYILLFFSGVISSFINVMAGGGSAIVLPLLIFLGLDGVSANATNRIAILLQNVSAVYSFKRKNHSDFKISWKLAIFTLPGGVIGAITVAKISGELFEKILGVVIMGIILTMLLPKTKENSVGVIVKHPKLIYPAMFLIGFYGGFIQVGVGFLLMAALHYLTNYSLVRVNMHKVFIVFIYTIPALAIFIFSGKIEWIPGLVLATGSLVGGWISASVSVKKGDKVIKIVSVITLLFMAAKLFSLF